MPQTTDPTFYRSPGEAIAAPPERLAYVAAYDPAGQAKDAMAVLDVDASSPSYGQVVGWSELPTAGNELHHFGWNACSSALCHQGHGDHGQPLERRYLIVPGIRSSRTYVLDTKPDPRNPKVVREITAEELAAKAGYSRPHTVHCGPGGIFMSRPRRGQRQRRPRRDRAAGPRHLRRHRRLGARPRRPVLRLRRLVAPEPRHRHHLRVGHPLDVRERPEPRGPARPPLRPPPQLLEHVPAHASPSGSTWATSTSWCSRSGRPTTPPRPGALSGVVISVEDLSASVWLWHRDGDRWAVRKVITVPAEPADPDLLPPALKPFGAVPAADQRHRPVGGRPLAVCVVLGHRRAQAVRRQRHLPPARDRLGPPGRHRRPPAAPGRARACRWAAARRWSRSAATAARLCHQLAVRGLGRHLLPRRRRRLGGQARRRPDTAAASAPDPRFFPNGDDFRGLRVHQTRLQGGDASSDSYCYTS